MSLRGVSVAPTGLGEPGWRLGPRGSLRSPLATVGRPSRATADANVCPTTVGRISSSLSVSPSRWTRRLDAIIILLGSSSLLCLVPLAIYFLYLASLNSRTPPTLVPGPWDFGAVLLGLSGFLLLAGPLFLSLVLSRMREHVFGNWAALKAVDWREARAWSLMAAGYLILMAVAISVLLRNRRRVTAVYNVSAAGVEPALTGVLDELGYPWRRAGGKVEVGVKKVVDVSGDVEGSFPNPATTVPGDQFQSTGHATLRWGGDWEGVRRDVEAVLPGALMPHAGGRNPIAGWLYTAAVAILVVMLLWTAVLIYIAATPAPI